MTNEAYEGTGVSGPKEQAREKLADVKERASDEVESRLTQQKSRAAETLSGVSRSLLLSSQHLREQQQGNASRYVERVATEVDRLAQFLDKRDISEIIDQVEDLARRQPAVFIGGAVALGIMAGRFLKSSAKRSTHGEEGGRDIRGSYRTYQERGNARADSRGGGELASSRFDTGL